MESQSVFPDGARLNGTLTFVSGYTSALVDQRNRADAPQLEKLEEQFAEIIERCKEGLEKQLPKAIVATSDENSIRSNLTVAVVLIEALKLLISLRTRFLEKNPEAKDFWTPEAQEILEDTLELFEEQAETLASDSVPLFTRKLIQRGKRPV